VSVTTGYPTENVLLILGEDSGFLRCDYKRLILDSINSVFPSTFTIIEGLFKI
jgi:hypothetical protein